MSSWSHETHRLIAERSTEKICDFLSELTMFSRNLLPASITPDIWRGKYENEGSNHVYYVDTGYGTADRAILTWTISLATELSLESDFSLIARIIGVLSHYTSDISSPMHCIASMPYSNYDHGDIDSWLESNDSKYGDIEIPTFTPEFQPNFYNYTMKQIIENARIADHELFPAMESKDTQKISDIVEKQIIKAVKFLTNSVYTAYLYSNETNIEAIMNPQDIPLIETPQLITTPSTDQRVFFYSLILGIIIAIVSLSFFRKRKQ
ncbi:MAG: zinc dependent phospholipase C family protein [Candidatus Hodarchaeales archaeon]